MVKYQDAKSGVWHQTIALSSRKGNYLEASGSAMFVYALAKSVRKGYLPATYLASAKKGYAGMLKEFNRKRSRWDY